MTDDGAGEEVVLAGLLAEFVEHDLAPLVAGEGQAAA